MIRDCTPQDAPQLAEIYNHYITTTAISFETEPVTPKAMAQRITETMQTYPWIVYQDNETLIGYAYATSWKAREAYRHTVEASVYLDTRKVGQGIGTQLSQTLIQRLKKMPIHCIMGGVALPNAASVGLLEKLGFEKVAHFKEVGQKHGKWIDVAYWQLILEGASN